jgi:very-short-patch-repair endonuclease
MAVPQRGVSSSGPAISVNIRSRGPILEKDTRRIVTKHLRAAKQSVGHELVAKVDTLLNKKLKTQTPYYRTKVDFLVNQGSGAVIVHDSGVVYGSWLEGTSRRNQTTRFKGYHVFRTVMQDFQGEVDQVVLEDVKVMVKELS